jgi:hypothetical protein
MKIHAGNTLLIRISITDENPIDDELLNAASPSDLRAYNRLNKRNKNLYWRLLFAGMWHRVFWHSPTFLRISFHLQDFSILSGVRLSPLGTAVTTDLLYEPQMIDEGDCRAIGGMKFGRGNRSTRRKPAPAPLCPPQIPHDQTRARTLAAAVGSQRLTAWPMARPSIFRIFLPVLSVTVLCPYYFFPFQLYSSLKMKIACSFEIYQTTRRQVPESINLHDQCREILMSHKLSIVPCWNCMSDISSLKSGIVKYD